LRPEAVRGERFFAGFFAHGASDDGGRDEVDESAARARFNSAISSGCSPITRSRWTNADSSSDTRASSTSTCCCNDPGTDTPRSSQTITHR
jgi:hypothetical protein